MVRSTRSGRCALSTLLLATACSSYQSSLDQFDAVSPIRQLEAEPTRTWTYRDLPDGGDEENPSRVARDSMTALTAAALGDLARTSEVMVRLLWVADLDPSPLNRIVALRGIGQMMQAVGMGVVALEMADPASLEDSERQLAGLIAMLQPDRTLSEADREQMRGGLQSVREQPLATRRQRRALVAATSVAWQTATDRATRDAAEPALRDAMHFAVHEIFLTTVRGDAPGEASLRQEAIAEIHRLGGPDSVAWLLAKTARSTDPTRPAYDPHPYVLLDLVRLCGQLDRERALRGYRDGPAPAEFLYELVAAPAGPRGLKLLALEALALSLNRPVSFEPEWANEWYRQWNQERIRGGTNR